MPSSTTSQAQAPNEPRFETKQLHAGRIPDLLNACAVPVYETASFAFNSAEHGVRLLELSDWGNIYSRITNPTVAVFQNRLAALEGGVAAVATASGTAAVAITMLSLAEAGDNFVSSASVHGGTVHMYKALAPRLGLECRFVDDNDPQSFASRIDEKTKFIFVESISNPKYEVPDFEALATIAHINGIPLVCDNTFGCAGFVCRPIDHGADIVVHSATKWIGGHGTTLGGIIVDGGTFDWGKHKIKFPQFHHSESDSSESVSGELSMWKAFGRRAFAMRAGYEVLRDIGSCLSPSSAQQLLIGLETLALRCERHAANAKELATWLGSRPEIGWVSYLGDNTHPSHGNACKYLRHGFGSVFSFGIIGGKDAGFALCDKLRLIINTTNLGDAKTLVVHPWSTTHQQLTDQERFKAGVTADHIRISVGIEHIHDLKLDLLQALDHANRATGPSVAAKKEEQDKAMAAQFGECPQKDRL